MELPRQVIDLRNKKYGRLTVLSFEGILKNRGAVWKCKCSCGVIKSIPGIWLRQLRVKSCGCFRKDLGSGKASQLEGKVFGRLKVLKRVGSTKSKNALWSCQCSCFKKTETTSYRLLSGKTKSCGCLGTERTSEVSLKNLVDQKFGRLVVLKRNSAVGIKPVKWLCRCTCGNKKVVSGNSLKMGKVKSCGCLRKELTSEKFFKDLTNIKFGKLRALKAKNRNSGSKCIKWICRCECGAVKEVSTSALVSGNTKSCGCSTGILNESSMKREVYSVFADVFNIKSNVRPSFLEGLEYDLYIPDLNLAIEYNGIQHYEYRPYFHKNKQELTLQQERDKTKKKLSEKAGVFLYIINYKNKFPGDAAVELILDHIEDLLPYLRRRNQRKRFKTVLSLFRD